MTICFGRASCGVAITFIAICAWPTIPEAAPVSPSRPVRGCSAVACTRTCPRSRRNLWRCSSPSSRYFLTSSGHHTSSSASCGSRREVGFLYRTGITRMRASFSSAYRKHAPQNFLSTGVLFIADVIRKRLPRSIFWRFCLVGTYSVSVSNRATSTEKCLGHSLQDALRLCPLIPLFCTFVDPHLSHRRTTSASARTFPGTYKLPHLWRVTRLPIGAFLWYGRVT